MFLGIITGGAGSGKSDRIESLIEMAIAQGKRVLVVVPERFSHIEEHTLCKRFGGLGVNGIEVSTFSKLARQMRHNGEFLRPSGREMMILKSAKENVDAGEGIFGNSYERNGFINKLSDTITEFKRNLVTPDMLKMPDASGMLGKKMSALAQIYESYNSMLGSDMADPDDSMSLLADAIEDSDRFFDTYILIDGFSDFMPAHYLVIEAMIKKANQVHIALTINDEGLRDPDGIYAPVATSVNKLERIAGSLGADCKFTHLDGEYSHIKSDDIKYFLSNYGQYAPRTQRPDCKNIKLDICANKRDEIERVAGRIMYEIRENGMRFRDIGVIIGNPDSYMHIIDSVFSEYGIPYFADKGMSATEHPIVRMILSVFKIIKENWSYQSVFEYLRSGFVYKKYGDKIVPIDIKEVDKLQLYCKSRGVRGRNAWLGEDEWKPLHKGVFDEVTGDRGHIYDISELDRVRRELMSPFVSFMQKIYGKRKVRELATALFEFLGDICLYDGLKIEQAKFEQDNLLDEASRISDVWGAIIETLDQAVMTSGDDYISREDFARMLEAGFSKCSVDSVPPSADNVSVGRADTTRPVRVKALFVVGAVRGEFPPESSDSGIITESDRAILFENGFELLQCRNTKMQIAEFNIYSSLTAACEKIYISYSEMNDEGTKNTPASIISDIEHIFGKLDTAYNKAAEWDNILASKNNTYRKLVTRVASDISEKERDFWNDMWEHTLSKEIRPRKTAVCALEDSSDLSIFDAVESERQDIISMLSDYKSGRTHIRPETAEKLYSGKKLSITSMEKYNKCPFSYFARYGLSLGEEGEYKVGGNDIGKMVHWAVCEYCRKVQEDADTVAEKKAAWLRLDSEKSKAIISSIMDGIHKQSLDANPDFLPERLAVICKRAENTIIRSAEIIRESIISGGFAAVEFEKRFNFKIEDDGESIEIEGAIDRLDIAEDEKGTLLRIIDYKTGEQKFSVADIYNKTSLQLVTYALAAEDMYKGENARISAVMYDMVRDELVKTAVGSPVSISAAALDGVIVSDGDEMQEDEIILHDMALAEKDAKSTFLPLQTKKAGGLKKSGMIISRRQFNMLSRYVKKTAIETKKNVASGYIEALPLGSDEYSPCAWCDYSAVCLHTNDKDRTRDKVTSAAKAWERIELEE